jgi:hypothetical protein
MELLAFSGADYKLGCLPTVFRVLPLACFGGISNKLAEFSRT